MTAGTRATKDGRTEQLWPANVLIRTPSLAQALECP